MYAVISLKWHQYIVKNGDKITVDKLENEDEKIDQVEVTEILSVFDVDWKNVKVWKPFIKWSVKLKILEQIKDKKMHVMNFKNKVRAGRNSKGQWFTALKTILLVENIDIG